MSKLNSSVKVPPGYNRSDLVAILSAIDNQVNALSEGRLSGAYNAQSVIPVATVLTPYAKGDFVRDTNASINGSAGAQYVRMGWICTSAPGGFTECRSLTGT